MLARGLLACSRRANDALQDLAVADGTDRQPVLVVPGRKAALCRIKPQLDLACFQHVAIRSSENGKKKPGRAWPLLPVEVQELEVRVFGSPFPSFWLPSVSSLTPGHWL